MNRRRLLKSLLAAIPVGAMVRVEPTIAPTDLIVIECPDDLEQVHASEIRAACQHLTAHERVIVLDRGVKLRVERGVARFEMTDEVTRS